MAWTTITTKTHTKPKEPISSALCTTIESNADCILFEPSLKIKHFSLWHKVGNTFWTSVLKEDALTKAHIETNFRTVHCKCLSCEKMKQRYRFGKEGQEGLDSLIMRSRKECKQQPFFLWIFENFLGSTQIENSPQTKSELIRFNRIHCGFDVSIDKRDFVWWNQKKGDIIAYATSNDTRATFLKKFFLEMKKNIHLWEESIDYANEQSMMDPSLRMQAI